MDSSNVDNVLNHFLQENGFECTAKMGTDFQYLYLDDLINYAVVVSEKMDRLFYDFAKRNGLKIDCGIFMLSFFHELGHYETLDLLDDGEEEYCTKVKKDLKEDDTEIYFNLPDEFEATMWAINYINSNPEKIRILAEEIQKELAIFYARYNIE